MRISVLLVISIASIFITVVGCKKEPEDSDTFEDNFDRKALFTNLSQNVVIPAFQDFETSTKLFSQSADSFGKHPDRAYLQALKKDFKSTRLTAKKLELLKFGPLNETKMYSLIDKWPTNSRFIEDFIAGEDSLTQAFIDSKGATSKGLPAIEYLIFGNEDSILNSFQNDNRRRQYLSSLASNLHAESVIMTNLWTSEGGNYATTYSNNIASGLDGSLSMTVNQMSSFIEYLCYTKVGKPLGKEMSVGQNPMLLEAPLSQHSRELLVANMDIFIQLFTGGDNELGFDDYLDYLQQNQKVKLSSEIINLSNKIKTGLKAENRSLYDIINSDPQSIEWLYEDFKSLLILIKTDMTSTLSVSLTFSDNDGD